MAGYKLDRHAVLRAVIALADMARRDYRLEMADRSRSFRAVASYARYLYSYRAEFLKLHPDLAHVHREQLERGNKLLLRFYEFKLGVPHTEHGS